MAQSFAVLLLVASLAVGCANQKKTMLTLENPAPVNCYAAEGDLRVLRSEKAFLAEEIAEGVISIVPASLVLGLLTGAEETRVKVATGQYNRMIDRRIAEIQQQCGTS